MRSYPWTHVQLTELNAIFAILSPQERGAVDKILAAIPPEEKAAIFAWMSKRGNGSAEKYYLLSLALAEAAHRRGEVRHDLVMGVVEEIIRRGSIAGILNLA